MNIYIKVLATLLIASMMQLLVAQVGLNTRNPRGVFHIDAGVVGTTTDDVVVLNNGNVGIGTDSPTTKLEIVTGGTTAAPISGFKLVDGSQGAQRVLTSDDDGLASWGTLVFSDFTSLAAYSKTDLSYTNATPFLYTGYSIAFPEAGTYMITIGIVISDSGGATNRNYAVQLMPTNTPNNWTSTIERYRGSYEAYPVTPPGATSPRIYYNQILTIPANRLTAFLMLAHSGGVVGTQTIGVFLGENAVPTSPQITGGSYVKIQ